MMPAMFACLYRQVSEVKVGVKPEPEPPQVNTVVVYRDELSKKQGPRKGVKSVRFSDSKPTILGELENIEKDNEKKSGEREKGIRVKVRMTKEEAARLLSKCKEGGVLDFKDVARELVSIPVNRVSVDVIPQ